MTTPRLSDVVVVGGCGFLGHHIVQQLLDAQTPSISVVDLRTTRNRLPSVRYYDGDITSADAIMRIFSELQPKVIIHTASPVASNYNPHSLYDKVNIAGTANLLACAAQTGSVLAFVYTSSASVVHDGVSDLYFATEEKNPVLTIPRQTDYYAHTKGVADGLVLAANGQHGKMLTAAIRPAGIFGEGDVQLIPGALNVFRDGKTGFQVGDNTNCFDFTYVGNVAYAHLLAARALLATVARSTPPLDHEKVDGEAFLITNDAPVPFWDMMRKIWSAAGWEGKPQDAWVIPKGLGLVIATILEWIFFILFWGKKEPSLKKKGIQYSCMNRTYDITKAKTRLGYKPLVGMEEGVKRGVSWFEEQEKKQAAESVEKKSA